jgi:hypothetical protein
MDKVIAAVKLELCALEAEQAAAESDFRQAANSVANAFATAPRPPNSWSRSWLEVQRDDKCIAFINAIDKLREARWAAADAFPHAFPEAAAEKAEWVANKAAAEKAATEKAAHAAAELGFYVCDDSAADLPEAVAARLDQAFKMENKEQDSQYSRSGDSALAAKLAATA